MKFEPNRYYEHSGGGRIHTLNFLDTFIWGYALIAESRDGGLIPVGTNDIAHTVNYREITKKEFQKIPKELYRDKTEGKISK